MGRKAHDVPSDVCAESGEVMVDGPGAVAFSFTPGAALETSDRLLAGAMEAQGQLVEGRWERKRRDGQDSPEEFDGQAVKAAPGSQGP
jgi:hypothetical protein